MAKGIDGLMEMTALGGVSRIGLEYLDRASEAANRLEDSSDEQALHDFRVSLRRLRTLLQAYDPYLEGRVGRKLRYDPDKEQFVGDEKANRFLNIPMRAPWHL